MNFADFKTWLWIAMCFYVALVAAKVSPYVGGSDSSGYYNAARMIARGEIKIPARTLPELSPSRNETTLFTYLPLGFGPWQNSREEITFNYPCGLSLLLALFSFAVGWGPNAAWVAALHTLGGVIVFYQLARRFGLSGGWAAFGAMVLGLSPLYLFMGTQTMSDVPALFWTSLTMLWAFDARTSKGLALATGAALGIAILLRPTNALLLVPLALMIGLDARTWAWLALGGFPFAVTWAAINQAAYGRFFATGYTEVGRLFSVDYIPGALIHYIHWLPILFPAVIFFAGWPFLLVHERRKAVTLFVWAAVFIGFYSTYTFTTENWWYLRFVLPAVPPLLIGALLVADRWFRSANLRLFDANMSAAGWVTSGLLVVAIGSTDKHFIRSLGALGETNSNDYHELARWLNENAPPNSVVAAMQCSGALYAYSNFTVVRWDMITSQEGKKIDAIVEAAHQPMYAALFAFEQPTAWDHLAGTWKKVFTFRDIAIFELTSSQPAKSVETPK